MPSGLTDFGANTWVSALMGVVSLPSDYYVALLTDEPGPAMDGTILAELEPTDSAYARQLYGTGSSNWGADGSYITTLNDIDFGVPLIDWGYITHWALCTAATAGSAYAWGEFKNPQNVAATTYRFVVQAGGLVLAMYALASPITV